MAKDPKQPKPAKAPTKKPDRTVAIYNSRPNVLKLDAGVLLQKGLNLDVDAAKWKLCRKTPITQTILNAGAIKVVRPDHKEPPAKPAKPPRGKETITTTTKV